MKEIYIFSFHANADGKIRTSSLVQETQADAQHSSSSFVLGPFVRRI